MNPSHSTPLGWIDGELAALAEQGLRRERRTHCAAQGVRLTLDGRDLVNFGSNDYLGLAADPRLAAAVRESVDSDGWGAGASPLVTGYAQSHRRLEERLADFEGTEAALLFTSGFAANAGTIPALVGRDDAIFGDERNHASIIDGCRLSRADVHVYRHCDCQHLESLLAATSGCRRRLIASDTLFSMDGDFAPLAELAALAERYDAMLLVDEAHATGVFGKRGRGLADEMGVESASLVRIGTLSKALGCSGGFVSGSRSLIDWLVNRARTYVFSTATPPAASRAAIAALDIVRDEPFRRQQLLAQARELRGRLQEQGWQIGPSASHIIPILVGDARRAMGLAAALAEQGFWVPGIRPPSVPPGQSLLRLSLSYAHTPGMIDRLCAALAHLSGQKIETASQ